MTSKAANDSMSLDLKSGDMIVFYDAYENVTCWCLVGKITNNHIEVFEWANNSLYEDVEFSIYNLSKDELKSFHDLQHFVCRK